MKNLKLDYTEEQFSLLLDALNHSLLLLNYAYHSAKLGCNIPTTQLNQKFENMHYEDIIAYTNPRLEILYEFYINLLTLEDKK